VTRLVHSLSFRLALIYVGLFCASVGALLGVYYWASVAAPMEQIRRRVDRETETLAQTYIIDGRDALKVALERRAMSSAKDKPFHAFINSDGKVVSANLPSWPRHTSKKWLEIEADLYLEGDEIDQMSLTRDSEFLDGARLLVGRDAEQIADDREQLGQATVWVLGGTILLGIIGGIFMSLAIHKRIEAVNKAARQVMAGDLSGRVPVRGTGDDFDRLGETLNLMLARIEGLFEAVRRVSDNVSHELRTPLTRLLSQLELAEKAHDDTDRRRDLMGAALAEGRRLHRIFDALLRIARIESGRHDPNFRSVDLTALMHDAVELYGPNAESRSVELLVSSHGQFFVSGDPDLLFQALSNLIDNALKYADDGGHVTVSIKADDDKVHLEVSDDGRGISTEEISRLTERFYRGIKTEGVHGEGLGLSLVAAVADLHKAELSFHPTDPGLTVRLSWDNHKTSAS